MIEQPDILAQPDGRPALLWRLPAGTRCVSSAVLGGGIGSAEWVVNVEVDKDYDREPVTHLSALVAGWGLAGRGSGLLTAAAVRRFTVGRDGEVECAATVGLTYPVYAADPASSAVAAVPGTINLVCWIPAPLADSALVNAVATATEAKAQALAEAGVAGTGTASDALVVCCPPGGREPYGGPRSRWGLRLANAVHTAVLTGTRDWQRRAR
ncbi:adenosylcobinamide amidohydrolase [Actinokineospora sp. UTMC 2448]|uniref:adenosylcobinamide amidohydrolase n=1 Tax=Actinokineospora sp. UTMC 2448 TaxID=2268449 RepID=UPI002164B92C|nr:adenosylcobinamide amidohydrolase [Actinokineospora sp. UTMC 2448]UVS79600.1 Adenosylcobinamide amidohydrolase [Actinokineospora sp. UTMC 2448]